MSSTHFNGNAERIRDNQRRSRARQKERLNKLESQVQNCKRLGIQASLEIQAAARVVLEENKHLRALLISRGWPSPVTDDQPTSQDRLRPSNSGAKLLEENLERHTLCNVEIDNSRYGDNPRVPVQTVERSTPASDYLDMSDPNSSLASSFGDSGMPEKVCGVRATPSPPEPVQKPSSVPIPNLCAEIDQSDTSTCAFAVNVITNMRPDIATNDVKSALECDASLAECRVDNSRFFAAVDQYAN